MKNILVAVSGLTPQIITETIFCYAVVRKPAVLFDEVRVLTTVAGRQRIMQELVGPQGMLGELCREYGLPDILLDEQTIHVFGGEHPLDDIRTGEDNDCMADDLTRVIRKLTDDDDTALYCTLAGGRKTMGTYLALLIHFFGREQDRLSHVLVPVEFEQNLVDEQNRGFFYPPKQPRVFRDRSGKCYDSAGVKIDLAEIPIVRLSEFVSAKKLNRFTEVVEHVRKSIGRESEHTDIIVDISNRCLLVDGDELKISPLAFSWYAAMLNKKKSCGSEDCGDCSECYLSPDEAMVDARIMSTFLEVYAICKGEDLYSRLSSYCRVYIDSFGLTKLSLEQEDDRKPFRDSLRDIRNEINEAINLSGVPGKSVLRIANVGRHGKPVYGVSLSPSCIRFIWPESHPARWDYLETRLDDREKILLRFAEIRNFLEK